MGCLAGLWTFLMGESFQNPILMGLPLRKLLQYFMEIERMHRSTEVSTEYKGYQATRNTFEDSWLEGICLHGISSELEMKYANF